MHSKSVDEFAKLLVKNVRDRSIDSFSAILVKNMNSPTTKEYVEKLGDRLENVINFVVPDVVDATIFYLLDAIDNNQLNVLYKQKDGSLIDIGSEGLGEMAGSYMSDDEQDWRLRFSEKSI